MSSAYIGSVVARAGNTATIRVYQVHPDYGLDPAHFVEEWGAMAIAGWAYSECYARTNFSCSEPDNEGELLLSEEEQTALAKSFGAFDNLFDASASEVNGVEVKQVELVRSALKKSNTKKRLREAGRAANEPLVHEVVMKICGILDITMEAKDDLLLAPLAVGVEWEF